MRLGTLLPRAVLVVLVWVMATAALTFAADRSNIVGASTTASQAPAQAPNLVVPTVTGQVFVFAKGILEDSGFAWRVTGSVHGYPGNRVVSQSPAPGTKVVDTGAPTIVLRLAKGQYAQNGQPEDTSSYPGTRIAFPHAPLVKPKVVTPKPKPALAPKPKAKVVKPKVVKPKAVKPKVVKPKVVKPKVVKPKVVKPKAKPIKSVPPASRPPAFTVHGGRKEPRDEISLPARANRLAAWVATHPARTNANVSHWLYQHAWIVDGAEFGWWHGAQALQTLIAVDRRIERMWGIGHRSERVARRALRDVERKSK
jgi:hypothetical protein